MGTSESTMPTSSPRAMSSARFQLMTVAATIMMAMVSATTAPTAAPTRNTDDGASDVEQIEMLFGFFGAIVGYLLLVVISISIIDLIFPNLVGWSGGFKGT